MRNINVVHAIKLCKATKNERKRIVCCTIFIINKYIKEGVKILIVIYFLDK